MLRITLALLILLLAGASDPPAPSGGNAQTQGEKHPAEHHSDPQNAQRGTPEAPFIVQIQQSQDQHSGAPETKQEGKWYTRPDWWLVGATFALVFVPGGLWAFTAFMWWQMRKDSNLRHRPRLIVRRFHFDGLVPGDPIQVHFEIVNQGDIDAQITARGFDAWFKKDGQWHDQFSFEPASNKLTVPAGGLPIKTIGNSSRKITDVHVRQYAAGELQLVAAGVIRYSRASGIIREKVIRETGFWRTHIKSENAFVASEEPEQEYQT